MLNSATRWGLHIQTPTWSRVSIAERRNKRMRWLSLKKVSCVTGTEKSEAEVADKVSENEEKPTGRKLRVLSGIQPTGKVHLGNYFGAMRNWVDMQDKFDSLFCVVDLHAITVSHDPVELRNSTKSSVATYIACGIDPEKAPIFVQSHVPAHSELCWLLNCVTPTGWLERMVQFKEKARKSGQEASVGLFDYPVLMAADILLYQADVVPVGDDQRQHLELARDIAGRVNNQFGGRKWKKLGGRGGRLFKVPEAFIPEAGARVMSLKDGLAKMSKSAEDEGSRICISDSPDVIRSKVKACKTDSFIGLEFDNLDRPECRNLLSIYQLTSGKSRELQDIESEVSDMSWGSFKEVLSDSLIECLGPIQKRYDEIMKDEEYLDSVISAGREAATEQANRTLSNVKEAMGLLPTAR